MYSCEKLARGTGGQLVTYEDLEHRPRYHVPVKVKTAKRSYFGNASVYSVNIEEYEQRPHGKLYRTRMK